jgi:hypothetical protein
MGSFWHKIKNVRNSIRNRDYENKYQRADTYLIFMQKPPTASNWYDSPSLIAGPFDVLCGRGKRAHTNPGNHIFQHLVSMNKHHYEGATRAGRIDIASEIVMAIRKQIPPGRFLDVDSLSGALLDIGDLRAFEKVSQALRQGLAMTSRTDFDAGASGRSPPSPELPIPIHQPVLSDLESADKGNGCSLGSNGTSKEVSNIGWKLDYVAKMSPSLIDSNMYPLFCEVSWRNVEEWSADMQALNEDNTSTPVSNPACTDIGRTDRLCRQLSPEPLFLWED